MVVLELFLEKKRKYNYFMNRKLDNNLLFDGNWSRPGGWLLRALFELAQGLLVQYIIFKLFYFIIFKLNFKY